jgi:hypothetical protein
MQSQAAQAAQLAELSQRETAQSEAEGAAGGKGSAAPEKMSEEAREKVERGVAISLGRGQMDTSY